MAGLAAGDYIVLASAQHGGPFDAVETGTTTTFAPTYFPGTLDRDAARVMVLAPGQTVTAVEFAILTVAAFRVSGIAVDRTGRPSPGAMVTIIPDLRTGAPFSPIMSVADDAGTFTIANVPPGTYRVMANANSGGAGGGIGAVSFGFTMDDDDPPPGPEMITVSSADVDGITVIAESN
jgi:hypothetical protein